MVFCHMNNLLVLLHVSITYIRFGGGIPCLPFISFFGYLLSTLYTIMLEYLTQDKIDQVGLRAIVCFTSPRYLTSKPLS